MRRIKTKMMIGLFCVFMVSFLVLMINIGANQRIANNSQSLLNDNYPSVKYSFEMLDIMDGLHDKLITSDSGSYPSAKLLNKFDEYLDLQANNITEPDEKELTASLDLAFRQFRLSIQNKEYILNPEAYHEKYLNLRQYVLSIHDLNIALLESKNEQIRQESLWVLNIQEKIGIIGLTLLTVFIILLPMLIINPIDKLTERMKAFYKTNFNKDIEIETNHELEKLEEIFEHIVRENRVKDV